MRFIVKHRDSIEPSKWLPMIEKFKLGDSQRTHDLPYLSAVSFEVPVGDLERWSSTGWSTNGLEMRPAELIRSFQTGPDEIANANPVPTPAGLPPYFESAGIVDVWKKQAFGAGIKVGIIDTGFDSDHPAIRDRVGSHHHLAAGSGKLQQGPRPNAPQLHGTFAAGIIGGDEIEKNKIGVAPQAELHLAETTSDVTLEDDAVALLQHLVRGQKCQLVCISLGEWKPLPWLDEALSSARRDGALPIIAIGNEQKGVARWPGACRYALSVGYCRDNGTLSGNSGSTLLGRPVEPLVPMVVAPGVNLRSCAVSGGLSELRSGSSYAAPVVAGIAALLLSRCKKASPERAEQAILKSCRAHPSYADRCGYGRVHAGDALQWLEKNGLCT